MNLFTLLISLFQNMVNKLVHILVLLIDFYLFLAYLICIYRDSSIRRVKFTCIRYFATLSSTLFTVRPRIRNLNAGYKRSPFCVKGCFNFIRFDLSGICGYCIHFKLFRVVNFLMVTCSAMTNFPFGHVGLEFPVYLGAYSL